MTTLSDSFALSISEKDNNINENLFDYNGLKIGHLKYFICLETKIKIDDYNRLKLWKVAINVNLKDIITEEQIKDKGEELVPIKYVSKYFPGQTEADESLIIVQVPTTGKCFPMFYLLNKKICSISYLIFYSIRKKTIGLIHFVLGTLKFW